MIRRFDFLVIGSGVAGMSYALQVAASGKGKVALVCKTSIEEANTAKAQGGVASVTNLKIDNFEKQHNCEDRDIKLMIRYAIEYEGYELCTDYGIRQFERFYPLYKQFNEAIKHSKEVAETMQDDPVVEVTPNSGERYIGFKVDLDNI